MVMKQEYRKMIQEVIDGIDWDKIHKLYENKTLTWIQEAKTKNLKSFKFIIPTLEDLKSDLKKVLMYVVQEDMNEFLYSHWTIFWDAGIDEEDGAQLDVMFSPIRFSINEKTMEVLDEVIDSYTLSPEEEIEILKVSLEESLSNEDYAMCAIIRDQITDLEKDIAKKLKKKKK